VLPVFPQHTGRRWDGNGASVRFTLPARWERDHPEHALPAPEWWVSGGSVEAAFIAHGRLLVWEDRSLVSPDERFPWAPREVAGSFGAVAWRSPLGPATLPAGGIRFEERVGVAGSRAVLATSAAFVQVDLRHAGGVAPLPGGAPLCQVGGPGWWAGWCGATEAPQLLVAHAARSGAPLDPEVRSAPAGALPAPRARMVLSGGRVFWPGRDGAVWELDPIAGTIRPVSEAATGLVDLWAAPDGPRLVRENQGQITVTLAPARGGNAPLTVAAGASPFRGAHVAGMYAVVVGERVTTFDARTGERLHEAVRPPGRWVDAAILPGEDGEPRLLVLTREAGFATLILVRLASGVHDLIWREDGIDPRALLPVEDRLYVAHSRGLVRFG